MNDDRAKSSELPAPTVGRLSAYLRELVALLESGEERVSSADLGALVGVSAVQVRKDLAHCHRGGQSGIGYEIQVLIGAIRSVLGTDRRWPIVVLGAGPMARALTATQPFAGAGFDVIACCTTAGPESTHVRSAVPVVTDDQLADCIREEGVRICILTSDLDDPSTATRLLRLAADAGLDAVLDLAPSRIELPVGMERVHISFMAGLERLAHRLVTAADQG
jgi:redox-sensing transcriptional repressor